MTPSTATGTSCAVSQRDELPKHACASRALQFCMLLPRSDTDGFALTGLTVEPVWPMQGQRRSEL